MSNSTWKDCDHRCPVSSGISRRLVLLNDGDLTYASVRLDPESLATATSRVADIADSMPRTLIWSAAWEMTRQSRDEARDFMALVSAGIAAESEIGVVQRVLATRNHHRPRLIRRSLVGGCDGLAEFLARVLGAQASDAGSDHQLAFVNTLLAGRLNDDQIPLVRGLLDGDDPARNAARLKVDTDLRWKLVRALATGTD